MDQERANLEANSNIDELIREKLHYEQTNGQHINTNIGDYVIAGALGYIAAVHLTQLSTSPYANNSNLIFG